MFWPLDPDCVSHGAGSIGATPIAAWKHVPGHVLRRMQPRRAAPLRIGPQQRGRWAASATLAAPSPLDIFERRARGIHHPIDLRTCSTRTVGVAAGEAGAAGAVQIAACPQEGEALLGA
eukprot:CAMPEP_0181199528 /NCGR_PEP_ID=MMETSP1096-20121128/17221_1 /TAXON_ID=156174 ORGANISM="Chrysochromulina ericina, Strain CCMP281" /NCGR_SAMPLE_ID=MMETSP1096 /ASSEMBLY_ACC=CAM_ASM_000453 /LENGTH=118 /DNA_ID=CAMNT_0023289709 /DNA_START=358 /DNA_END=715 /DNA_ORIENTATION=+